MHCSRVACRHSNNTNRENKRDALLKHTKKILSFMKFLGNIEYRCLLLKAEYRKRISKKRYFHFFSLLGKTNFKIIKNHQMNLFWIRMLRSLVVKHNDIRYILFESIELHFSGYICSHFLYIMFLNTLYLYPVYLQRCIAMDIYNVYITFQI